MFIVCEIGELSHLENIFIEVIHATYLLNEFRLNGTYADLDGNDGIGRAMVNLTGGEVNRFMLQEFHTGLDTLYKLIEQAIQHGQMVGCCTSHDHVRK
jgi:hypothetical protein